MNYVIAAWSACAAIIGLYSLRTLRRARALRDALSEERDG